MKLEELTNSVIHLKFPTQVSLCSTFLRFQEHFESPEFRGKSFTLEEYKKWYIANSPKGQKTGEFTYYTDWKGFNIPSHILESFFDGAFNPLSEEESRFLELFRKRRGTKFYIIGTFEEGSPLTLRHEIAHGLFYVNEEYRMQVLEILKDVNIETKNAVFDFFAKSGGYHPDVWEDELHTYSITGLENFEKKGIDVRGLIGVSRRLNELFDTYPRTKDFS